MKSTIGFLISAIILSGCASTTMENEYPNLIVSNNEMQSSKWQQLNRFSARYPMKAVMKSDEGCTTVEYVITPQYEIKDIKVIASTKQYFADAAVDVIKNWKWNEVSNNILTEPVKTQTRFDFCLDKANQSCKTIVPEYSCPGDDILYSTGRRIG